MYLLCCSEINTEYIVNKVKLLLNITKKDITTLNLMQLELRLDEITEFKQNVGNYEYIIFVSPSCIYCVRDVIPQIKNTIFLVMGSASYKYLRKLTNLEILYPVQSRGADSLITEVIGHLNVKDKNVLLVKGVGGNLMFGQKLLNYFMQSDSIDVYSRRRISIDKSAFLRYVNDYNGIIITSSVFVTQLFDLAREYGVVEKLQDVKFITWHNKIKDVLYSYGTKNVQYCVRGLE